MFTSDFVSFWGKQQQKLSQCFERLLKRSFEPGEGLRMVFSVQTWWHVTWRPTAIWASFNKQKRRKH